MTKAIRIHKNGGPEVLSFEEVAVGEPGPGQARVRHQAVGLNFIDIYFRTGLYPSPAMPAGLGMEGAGIVEAVGSGVTHVKAGDRVAYAGGGNGAYAESRIMPAAPLVKLPESLSFEQGAAMMLQGMTVQYLIKQSYPVKAGDTVLWTAAAGGVGLFAMQWLKALGVTVIGTVSSDAKAEVARAHGCTHTIVTSREDTVARVKEITGGKGVPVVYDSVGRDTWESSLDSLAPLGYLISFGNASGAVPPVNLGQLSQKGSIYVQRPTLMTYTAERARLERMAADLFDVVAAGKVKVTINHRYALKDAAQAQADLEGRRTTGSAVLMP
ncbi:MAG: quinone oxidoreductase family protein [Burkholderiales bacterium]